MQILVVLLQGGTAAHTILGVGLKVARKDVVERRVILRIDGGDKGADEFISSLRVLGVVETVEAAAWRNGCGSCLRWMVLVDFYNGDADADGCCKGKQRGMLAGREREGLPKLLADVAFDMRSVTTEGLVAARLARPSDIVLAQGVFRPSQLIGEISADTPTVGKLGLRVVGSPVPRGPLAICELVPSAIEYSSGEMWSGDGSLLLTGGSELSPVLRLSVVGDVEATALRNASFRVVRPTQTYPLGA
jgi:Acetoacetate decarboxylase (ADC)